MKMKLLAFLGLLLMAAPVPVLADTLGLLAAYPFQFQFQCNEEAMTGVLQSASARLRFPGEVAVYVDRVASNNPTPWETWLADLFWARDFILDSHGFYEGNSAAGLLVEPYLDATYAVDAYLAYRSYYGEYCFIYSAEHKSPGLTYFGIQSLLGPWARDTGNMMIYACYSSYARDAFGNFTSGSSGAFFGYPIAVDNSVACDDRDIMVRTMACEDYDWTGLENDILTAYRQSSFEGTLFGNGGNSWNPAVSCKSWDAVFSWVAASEGKLRWMVLNEQKFSQYLVEGVNALGDSPDTLAVVNGYGSDGAYVYRSFEVDVPDYRYLRVREIDDLFVVTSTDWVQWGDAQAPPLHPGDEIALDLKPLTVTADGSIAGAQRQMSPEQEMQTTASPADVVVYTTMGFEAEAHRIKGLAQMTEGYDGQPLRARVYTGASDDPLLAQDIYRAVVQANAAYNAGNPVRPYREYPHMVLAGAGLYCGARPFRITSTVSPHGFVDTFAPITDCDGDDLPEGPLSIVPLKDYAEADRHSNATAEFNSGAYSSNGLLLCLDDSYGGVDAQWMQERLFEDLSVYAGQRGLLLRAPLKDSDYPIADQNQRWHAEREAGAAAIGSGVREIWYTGLSVGATNWTNFLDANELVPSTQRFLVFGPGCNFGHTTLYMPGSIQVRDWMFEHYDRGIMVGGIGQLNAAYYHNHRDLAFVMQEVLAATPPGTFLADVGLEVQRRFLELYPEQREYALGIVAAGSVARSGMSGLSAVDDPSAGLLAFNLKPLLGTGMAGVSFSLPRSAHVSLEIYDLRGRRVAGLIEEELAAGSHSKSWNADGVPSGLYFALLTVGDNHEVAKLTLVK